jgi:poly(3-hydroxyalkanoate) depolymerase
MNAPRHPHSVRTPHVRVIDADGVQLRICTRGEGRPLLLLTGIGANIEMWEPFEHALEGFPIQTISVDLPGTGGSPPLVLPRRMPGLARIVERLLDALGHPVVDVLGVSFGGALAQQLAHQAPRRVRRLILAATGPGVPGLGGVSGSPRAVLKLVTPRRYYDPAHLAAMGHVIFGGRASTLHETDHAARVQAPPSLRGYFYLLWAIQGWTALPWLWSIQQPTLVLGGDDDRILPLCNSRILARCIRNARLEVVRGGGHMFLLHQAREVAPYIEEFLAN